MPDMVPVLIPAMPIAAGVKGIPERVIRATGRRRSILDECDSERKRPSAHNNHKRSPDQHAQGLAVKVGYQGKS
jgi:hypothetical protein